MNYIDQSVSLLQSPAFEGTVSWLYLDTHVPPNATTACGLLVENLACSQALPWYLPDWTAASESDIAADWARVTGMPGGKVAGFYHSATGLALSLGDIAALTRKKVVENDSALAQFYAGYDAFPTPVKLALLDMAYNLGVEPLEHTYPKFNAAINARQWSAAAAECGRNVQDAAFADRTAWTKAPLLSV